MTAFCSGQVRRKGKRFVPCVKPATATVEGNAYCFWHANALRFVDFPISNMNPIATPKPVETPVAATDTPLFRLEMKRVGCGLTPDEQAALAGMYAELEREGLLRPSQQDVDAMAEEHTEGRTYPQRHVNPHE